MGFSCGERRGGGTAFQTIKLNVEFKTFKHSVYRSSFRNHGEHWRKGRVVSGGWIKEGVDKQIFETCFVHPLLP